MKALRNSVRTEKRQLFEPLGAADKNAGKNAYSRGSSWDLTKRKNLHIYLHTFTFVSL